jgi:hypothetical protein
VGVAAGTGVWLDVSTASGTTRNGLDMPGGLAQPGPEAAGLELKIRTASGDVDIRRVTADLPATA